MKKYIQPQIELIETEINSILAGSEQISVGTPGADPSSSLAPEIDIIVDDITEE